MSKLIDLTGKVFGGLRVVRRHAKNKGGKPQWVCRCSCGRVKTAGGQNLRRGITISCGCSRAKDLVGKVFGRWTVVKRQQKASRDVMWVCKCKCGTTRSVAGSTLKRGSSQSCGCSSIVKKVLNS